VGTSLLIRPSSSSCFKVMDSILSVICGNDREAKAKVTDLLVSFGWNKDYILDLGGSNTCYQGERIRRGAL
jgi:predicted dinucleotide-binding enzyme